MSMHVLARACEARMHIHAGASTPALTHHSIPAGRRGRAHTTPVHFCTIQFPFPKQAVARLTADNLVFLTRAREAEAALGAARMQAADLRAALDEHRGPWFEEVAVGVEERVRAAMGRADALERELAAVREAAAAMEQVRQTWGAVVMSRSVWRLTV